MKLSKLIEDFKKHVDNLDENVNFEDFDESLVDIQDILTRINIENNRRQDGYFIAINDIGSDDDFIRYYTPIGRMTRADALRILNTLGDGSEYYSSGWDDHVEQVPEKTYAEWYALATYSITLSYLNWMNVEYRLTDDELHPIENKVLQLRQNLGLTHRWEEVRLYKG